MCFKRPDFEKGQEGKYGRIFEGGKGEFLGPRLLLEAAC